MASLYPALAGPIISYNGYLIMDLNPFLFVCIEFLLKLTGVPDESTLHTETRNLIIQGTRRECCIWGKMYRIEKTVYGLKLIFDEFLTDFELYEWIDDCEMLLETLPYRFGMLLDIHTLQGLSVHAEDLIEGGFRFISARGLERSAVIFESAILRVQFSRISKRLGMYESERYIDSSLVPNWEHAAEVWLEQGSDPDKVLGIGSLADWY